MVNGEELDKHRRIMTKTHDFRKFLHVDELIRQFVILVHGQQFVSI